MLIVPNEEQRAAIAASLKTPVPAHQNSIGYYAARELKGTPFETCGFLSAYALQFAPADEVPKPRKRKEA